MLDRIKYFWEKLALVIIVLMFLLFELRVVLVIPEVVVEILFAVLNFYLLLGLIKNVKRYVDIKWQKQQYYR